MLPWLAILILLALKPNRGWSAWWIWLPLGCLAVGGYCLKLATPGSSNGIAQEALGLLLEVPLALAFGLAALWLLAPYLGRGHRLRGFFGILAVLAGSIVFSFGARVGWGLGLEPIASLLDPRHCAATANVGVMALPFLAPLTLPAPGLAAAMILCGLVWRVRYGSFRLSLWLLGSLLAVWVAGSALAYGLWRLTSPASVEYAPFLGIALLMVAVTFAVLLPYLILSAASPLFRERLTALLHVRPEAPPTVGAAGSQGASLPWH